MTSNSPMLACPHAAQCPGCPSSGLAASEQLDRQRLRVVAALARFPETSMLEVGPSTSPGPRVAYRTRAKWVADKSGKIGLFARGTHDVVDADPCPVLCPSLQRVAAALRRIRPSVPALSPHLVRGVDLRDVVGEDRPVVLVTITYDRDGVPSALHLDRAEEALREALADDGIEVSLSTAEHDGSPRVLGVYRNDGARARLDRIGEGPRFFAAHGSFIQAHRGTAAAIHDRIVEALAPLGRAPRVLELHAGSGALALRLAQAGASVIAVERFAPAIELARRSAVHERLESRVRAIAADASEAVLDPELGDVDAIVVNPPRRGITPDLREALSRSRAARVLYVACDPETLARDLAVLARMGLAATRVEAFDMMPQTFEVESLALLERARGSDAPGWTPRVLVRGERWLAVEKPPHEPTTPHPEHASSLLARVRRLPGLAEATPVHRLDLGTSGVCLFADTPADVSVVSEALTAGQKTYVAMVRGIVRPKGTIRRPLREGSRTLEATTRYRRKAIEGGHSLVEVQPEQGRMHQIRRHLASIDHPVVGDARYGHPPTNKRFEEVSALDRPFLHCARIALTIRGEAFDIEAPLAPDLELVRARLAR